MNIERLRMISTILKSIRALIATEKNSVAREHLAQARFQMQKAGLHSTSDKRDVKPKPDPEGPGAA